MATFPMYAAPNTFYSDEIVWVVYWIRTTFMKISPSLWSSLNAITFCDVAKTLPQERKQMEFY